MATELREQRASRVVLEPRITTHERRSLWPLLATGVALAGLVVAGALFFSRDAATVRFDPRVIEKLNTSAREGGEYVVLPDAASIAEPTTEAREGGTYLPPSAAVPADTQPIEPTTPSREGGGNVDDVRRIADAMTEAREGGEYATP